jgi:hypothetical protein
MRTWLGAAVVVTLALPAWGDMVTYQDTPAVHPGGILTGSGTLPLFDLALGMLTGSRCSTRLRARTSSP